MINHDHIQKAEWPTPPVFLFLAQIIQFRHSAFLFICCTASILVLLTIRSDSLLHLRFHFYLWPVTDGQYSTSLQLRIANGETTTLLKVTISISMSLPASPANFLNQVQPEQELCYWSQCTHQKDHLLPSLWHHRPLSSLFIVKAQVSACVISSIIFSIVKMPLLYVQAANLSSVINHVKGKTTEEIW